MSFGARLERNARLATRSVTLREEVSNETLHLETARVTFGGSLDRNARFADSLCPADLHGPGGKCVCVAPCHWGARNMLV